jgi:hypothetical protein
MRHSYIFIPLSLFMRTILWCQFMIGILCGACVALLVGYILLVWFDKEDTK